MLLSCRCHVVVLSLRGDEGCHLRATVEVGAWDLPPRIAVWGPSKFFALAENAKTAEWRSTTCSDVPITVLWFFGLKFFIFLNFCWCYRLPLQGHSARSGAWKPIPIPAKIWWCSFWSRSMTLASAKSEHPRLTKRGIIFEEFQPMWSRYLSVTDKRTHDRRLAIEIAYRALRSIAR